MARAVFYMHQEYGLTVDPTMGALLQQWNRDDPPNNHENRRNDAIERLQGTRNPFIDDHTLANSLAFSGGGSGGGEEETCNIKGNISSSGRIYHTPSSSYYDAVTINTDQGERWFCSVAEAEAAGWRAPN